jgi:hypothetical protein
VQRRELYRVALPPRVGIREQRDLVQERGEVEAPLGRFRRGRDELIEVGAARAIVFVAGRVLRRQARALQ